VYFAILILPSTGNQERILYRRTPPHKAVPDSRLCISGPDSSDFAKAVGKSGSEKKKGLLRKRDNPFHFSLEGGCGLELGRVSNQEHEDDQPPQGQTQQERPEHPFLGIGKLHVPIAISFQIGDVFRVYSGPPVLVGPAIFAGPPVRGETEN
jgi:hypothetical protein